MKKNKLLTLSIAALLGFGTVGSLGIRFASKKATVVANTTLSDTTVEDKNGQGIAFPNHVRREGEAEHSTVFSKLGVRLMDADEGKKAIQFVAALTGYSDLSAAKFTRTVTGADGAVIKAQDDIAVKNVYTSLAAPSEVVWDTSLKSGTTYFYMIYTLNNIPATADYATIDVSFTATYTDGTVTEAVNQKANVQGLKGLPEKNSSMAIKVGVQATDTEATKYYAGKIGSDTTTVEVTVPERWFTLEGHVAKNEGPVTALAYGTVTDSNGAFESWSKLEKVNMPATITAFDKYCFASTKIKEVEFPRDLTNIQDYAFGYPSSGGLSTLKTVYYNAKNLTTVGTNGYIGNTIETVYVSADVESIPNTKIFGNVEKVVYAGTEAQWAALMGTENKSGLNIDNVICSDTVTYAVTYNMEGGTFNGSEDAYTVNVKSGKTAKDVLPTKAGYKFMGWYTAAEGGELVNFEAVSAPIVAYAHWGDFPAGSTKEKAVVLSEGYFGNHTAEPGMESVWSKFTATEAGRYYIDQSNVTYDSSNAVGTHATSAQAKIRVFKDDGTEVTYTSPSSSGAAYAKVFGKSASTYGRVGIDFEAGETYYFQMYVYYSTYYPDEHAYGSFDIKFGKASYTNDSPETAEVVNPESGEVNVEYMLGDWAEEQRFYKFTATKDAEYFFTAQSTGSTWAGVYVKEGDADGNFVYDSNKLAYSYGTGSMSGSANIQTKAGKTYYIMTTVNSTNSNVDPEKLVGFKLTEPPAGSSEGKAITSVLGTDGTPIAITAPYGAGTYNYYKVSVAHEGQYKAKISVPSSTYNEMTVTILDSEGATVVTGTNKASSYSYKTSVEVSATLPAGDYTVKIGWTGSSWPSSNGTISASMWEVLPGSELANAIEDMTDAETISIGTTTTLANEYHKFVATATAGYYWTLTSTAVTGFEVLDSTGAAIVKGTAGQEDVYSYLEEGNTYYILFKGAGELMLNMHHGAIKPDGSTRAKAYDWEFDSTGKQAMLDTLPAKAGTWVYYKKTFTEADLGTYRFYSANDSSIDTKVNAIYKDDATTKVADTYNDDDSGKHPEYTVYRYDFYIEFEITEPGDYYFEMKAITSTTSGVAAATYLDYHLEAISLINGSTDPETPPAVDPDAPAYAGQWTDGTDVLTLNADGRTGNIGGVGFVYEWDDDEDEFVVTSENYAESIFVYFPDEDVIQAYFYDPEDTDSPMIWCGEGEFLSRVGSSTTDPETPATPAAAYLGYEYGGKIGLNNVSCSFDNDGTHVTWNGTTVTYTVNASGVISFTVGDLDVRLTYNSNDSFAVEQDYDGSTTTGTLSAMN